MPEVDRSVVVTGCGAGIGRAIFEQAGPGRLGGGRCGAGSRPRSPTPGRCCRTRACRGSSSRVTPPTATCSPQRARPRRTSRRSWLGQQRGRRRPGPAARPRRRARHAAVPAQRRRLLLGLLGGRPGVPRPGHQWRHREHLLAPGVRVVPEVDGLCDDEGRAGRLDAQHRGRLREPRHPCQRVAPGPTWTPWNEANIARSDDPAAAAADFEALAPLGRAGQAPEIASVVSFLLSDEASYVTGVVVPVDGGTITRPFRYTIDTRGPGDP